MTVRDFFCLSEDRLCKPLQFNSIWFDIKHANDILLWKEWHVCDLISLALSKFILGYIYPESRTENSFSRRLSSLLDVLFFYYFIWNNKLSWHFVGLYFLITPCDSVNSKRLQQMYKLIPSWGFAMPESSQAMLSWVLLKDLQWWKLYISHKAPQLFQKDFFLTSVSF